LLDDKRYLNVVSSYFKQINTGSGGAQ